MNQKGWVIGLLLARCLLFGCDGLRVEPSNREVTSTVTVTTPQTDNKVEITPTIHPDPCGWRARENPVITETQDGNRVQLAPKIGEKKIVFLYSVGSLAYDQEGIRNVRIEISSDDFIDHLGSSLTRIQEVEKYFGTNNELIAEYEDWRTALYRNFLQNPLTSSFVLPDTQIVWEVDDMFWLDEMIDQGRVAIYDLSTGQCLPYYDVKEWEGSCIGGRKFYKPDGTVFRVTVDYIC